MISKKVVLIGDFSTGKTSLIRRYVDNQFSDTYLSTLGVKISKKECNAGDSKVMNLIWDIEGGTENKPVNRSYLQGAHGCIIVADLTRSETIEHVAHYIEENRSVNGAIPIVAALNKCDLLASSQSAVLQQELQARLDQLGGVFVTSAKTAEAVEMMFETLAVLMVE